MTDWQATANNLSLHPEIAVQVAVFLLHDPSAANGAAALLQSIPNIDLPTRTRMLAATASIRIETRLAREPWGQVTNGLGLGGGTEVLLDTASRDEAVQHARRLSARNQELELQLTEAYVQMAGIAWGSTPPGAVPRRPASHRSAGAADPLDPDGHYRRLAAHPTLFVDRTEAQAMAILTRLYRRVAQEHHPDAGGDPVKFIAVHQSFEFLSDPVKRAAYGVHGPNVGKTL